MAPAYASTNVAPMTGGSREAAPAQQLSRPRRGASASRRRTAASVHRRSRPSKDGRPARAAQAAPRKSPRHPSDKAGSQGRALKWPDGLHHDEIGAGTIQASIRSAELAGSFAAPDCEQVAGYGLFLADRLRPVRPCHCALCAASGRGSRGLANRPLCCGANRSVFRTRWSMSLLRRCWDNFIVSLPGRPPRRGFSPRPRPSGSERRSKTQKHRKRAGMCDDIECFGNPVPRNLCPGLPHSGRACEREAGGQERALLAHPQSASRPSSGEPYWDHAPNTVVAAPPVKRPHFRASTYL